MKELVNLIKGSPNLRGVWMDKNDKYHIHEPSKDKLGDFTFLTREEILELGVSEPTSYQTIEVKTLMDGKPILTTEDIQQLIDENLIEFEEKIIGEFKKILLDAATTTEIKEAQQPELGSKPDAKNLKSK